MIRDIHFRITVRRSKKVWRSNYEESREFSEETLTKTLYGVRLEDYSSPQSCVKYSFEQNILLGLDPEKDTLLGIEIIGIY